MRSLTEGALALLVVVAVGAGLFLFTGESLGDDATATTAPITVDPDAAVRGMALAASEGCLQCHTVDGRPGSGPTWASLAGRVRPLTDGDEAIADDTYLFSSIVDPGAQIVDGYDDLMPKFYSDQLSETQINDLVEYIKSLA